MKNGLVLARHLRYSLSWQESRQQEIEAAGHTGSSTRNPRVMEACFCSIPFSFYAEQDPSQGMASPRMWALSLQLVQSTYLSPTGVAGATLPVLDSPS